MTDTSQGFTDDQCKLARRDRTWEEKLSKKTSPWNCKIDPFAAGRSAARGGVLNPVRVRVT